jgi:alanine racemase
MLTAHQLSQSSRRDAWVEIDLGKLEKNIHIVNSWLANPDSAGTVKIMGAVKSDGYGHGAVAIAEVLAACGVTWLGVASVDEGVELREAGIKLPILVLGPAPLISLRAALDFSLDLTVSSKEQLRELASQLKNFNRKQSVHLKVDTGMHRLGISHESVAEVLDQIEGNPLLELKSVYSHLAKADDFETTKRQNNLFVKVKEVAKKSSTKPFFHIANSDASRRFSFTHHDLVRPGINIYGLEARKQSDDIEPIMAVRSRLNQISEVKEGESVGYNLTWTAKRPSKLACIPVGYGDGVDRGLSNKMKGILHGQVVPQVGIISMDQMLFDITDVQTASLGDVLTLIGSEPGKDLGLGSRYQLTLADWAQELDSITYEMAVRLRMRLPRIYTRQSLRSPQGE